MSKPTHQEGSRTSLDKKAATLLFAIAGVGIIILVLSFALFNKVSESLQEKEIHGFTKADTVVRIEVLNGCGAAGLGDMVTEYLRSDSIDVINTANYFSFDLDYTLVIDRTGNPANALLVAEVLGLSKDAVIQQINKNYFLDVSVLLGRDYRTLKPVKEIKY